MKKKNNDKNKNSSIFLDIEDFEKEQEEYNEELNIGIDIVNRNKEELDSERKERIDKFKRYGTGKAIEADKVKYHLSINKIVLIVIGLLLIMWLLMQYGPIFGIHIGNGEYNLEENKVEIVTTDKDIYKMYNEEVLIYSNNGLRTYNNKGELTWEYMFSESFSPSIYINGKYMIVTNDSTGTVFLFDNKKEILNKKIDGTIRNVFLDKYGNFGIEYSNVSGYTDIISVYSKNGTNKFDAYLPQETIISVTLLDNATKMLVIQAEASSFKIGVKLKIIDTSLSDNKNIKEIASLDNQFVFDVNVQGSNIYVLLDNKIVCIDINTGNIVDVKDFSKSQMLFVSIRYNYYTYVERKLEDDTYIIENVSYNGNSISSISIDAIPKNLVSGDLVNYYIYQDRIIAINKWGIELRNVETNFTPKQAIIFNNERNLALIYTNKIYIINL